MLHGIEKQNQVWLFSLVLSYFQWERSHFSYSSYVPWSIWELRVLVIFFFSSWNTVYHRESLFFVTIVNWKDLMSAKHFIQLLQLMKEAERGKTVYGPGHSCFDLSSHLSTNVLNYSNPGLGTIKIGSLLKFV